MNGSGTISDPYQVVTASDLNDVRNNYDSYQVSKISDETTFKLLSIVNQTDIDLVWVGLSVPKSHIWISENMSNLNAIGFFSVGAAFDYYANNLKRAPILFRKMGIEFLYRSIFQPKILTRQVKAFFIIILSLRKINWNTEKFIK
jgi:exopolysaccharide biosynthesis WecB/TagA/CpsF family protein